MKTVEEIRKEIEKLEIKIEKLETEQADCNWGSAEYDAIEAKVKRLYSSLDKGFIKLDKAKRVW